MAKKGKTTLQDLDKGDFQDRAALSLPKGFTWEVEVPGEFEIAIEEALAYREVAFSNLEQHDLLMPTMPEKVEAIKALRTQLAALNTLVGEAKTNLWKEFREKEPKKAAWANADQASHDAIDAQINAVIDESDLVLERNAVQEQVDTMQAEIDKLNNLRPDAFEAFAQAENIIKEAGLDYQMLFPRSKKDKGGDAN